MSDYTLKNLVWLRNRLFEIIKEKSLFFGDFTLSSGLKSGHYFDLKRTTLDPEGAAIIAKIFLDFHKGVDYLAVGGSTLGADPIVGSLMAVSHLQNEPKQGFIVRKATKNHGTKNLIEGGLKNEAGVILVDDVITTGKAIFEAAAAVSSNGNPINGFFAIINRTSKETGTISFQGADYPVRYIFSERDFLVNTDIIDS
ncbi:MAG: orotate phosphoribosyltransferase [bacterium]